MGRVRVVTDSTADMDTQEAEQLGVTVVPLNVHWGSETYLDKVEISIDQFYQRLREGKLTPRTSQPPAGRFEEAYRRLLEDADGIVSIHISSKLSGTVNAAQIAAHNTAPDKIAVIDSLTTSFALGLLAIRVARLAQEGASLAECVALAERLVPRLKLVAAVDTLEYLRRGGRIGRAQAIAGNLLAIKLVFQVLDGVVTPIDRVRTRAVAVRRVAEAVDELGPIEELAVLYGDDPEPARQLLRLIQESHSGLPIGYGRIGAVLGTHTGPGVFGVAALLAE